MVNTSGDDADTLVDDEPTVLPEHGQEMEQGQEMREHTPRPQPPAPAPRPIDYSKGSSQDMNPTLTKTNLKDGWNASNHNLNYLPQVITFQRRILCFEIRELNLQALAQHRENSVAACKVLASGADLAAPLGSQSYAKPEFMGPHSRRDGKHPDAMIKDFRALLDNTQDATHRVAICSGTREFIKHKSHNKTYISDEQLHAMELCIYHGIKVQVEGLDGERISQMC